MGIIYINLVIFNNYINKTNISSSLKFENKNSFLEVVIATVLGGLR